MLSLCCYNAVACREQKHNTKTQAVLLRTYRSGLSNGPVFRIGGDEQLHDAFTRADQLMYDRKKELKSMGAKTRES